MYKYIIFFLLLFLIINFTNCTKKQEEINEDTKLQIMVSILPQKYFIEKIGGDKIDVDVMVSAGSNPAIYEPSIEQMKKLTKTEAYFRIHIPFENVWMQKFLSANPKMRIIDTTKGIKRRYVSHHHNEKTEEMLDPHIWLSPPLVIKQIEIICSALVEIDTLNNTYYENNKINFIREIVQLDSTLHHLLDPLPNKKFIVFHPSFGYFADAYGLEQIPIEIEGKEPSASELANLIDFAKKENIKVIFIAPQFNTKSAETIASQIDGKTIIIDPLAEDWSNNLRHIGEEFAKVLGEVK